MAKKQKAKAKTKARRGAKRAAVKGRKAVKARKAAKKSAKASRPTAPKPKERAGKTAPARRSPGPSSGRKPVAGASAAREVLGEGKADEQYRERLRKFAKTHDVEALAREAGRDLEPGLRESEDRGIPESRAEEEPEW